MDYRSVDDIQKFLAKEVFGHTESAKKAAGRALGTLVEIITFYLIRQWGLGDYVTIEHRLQEFANSKITHNVEFAINPKLRSTRVDLKTLQQPLTSLKILKEAQRKLGASDFLPANNKSVLSAMNGHTVVNNAAKIAYNKGRNQVMVANMGSMSKATINILSNRPFSIFECKRVGIEEGAKKGPTTIEKAKQGAYVALHASSFQKIRGLDGNLYGAIPLADGKFIIKPYDEGLKYYINRASVEELKNFVLTVGVVSNHGNWFTSSNPNKELLVLMQSYDWLLFLSDRALSQFIEDLILDQKSGGAVREAFSYSYKEVSQDQRRKNIFTKVNMDFNAHLQIEQYFSKNIGKINKGWFNVLAPEEGSVRLLKEQLKLLANKGWT